MVRQAPAGHDGAAAGDDAGDPVGGQRDVPQQHAGVDGHVVDALLALLDHGVPEDLPGQGVCFAVDLLQRLVDRDRADGDGGVADDPFAGRVDVVPGRKVHHRVRAPLRGPLELVDLLGDGAGYRGVADVRVDLHQERLPDDHRLGLRVVDVAGDDGPAGGDFAADKLDVAVLPQCDEAHLRCHDALPRVMHLGDRTAFDGAARFGRCAPPFRRGGTASNRGLPVVEQVRSRPLYGSVSPRPAIQSRRKAAQAHHRVAARARRCGRPGTAGSRRRPGRAPGRFRSPGPGFRRLRHTPGMRLQGLRHELPADGGSAAAAMAVLGRAVLGICCAQRNTHFLRRHYPDRFNGRRLRQPDLSPCKGTRVVVDEATTGCREAVDGRERARSGAGGLGRRTAHAD